MVNMRWDERVCEWGLTASNPYMVPTTMIVLANPYMVPTTMIVLANPYINGHGMPCPYDPIDMIVDVEGEVVTIWKTILSLLWGGGTNGFEGADNNERLKDG